MHSRVSWHMAGTGRRPSRSCRPWSNTRKNCRAGRLDAVLFRDKPLTGYAPPASDPFCSPATWRATSTSYITVSGADHCVAPPVRFAERLAILDQLTDGKILAGIGSGTPQEMIGFGVTFADSKTLSNDNMEIAERLWARAR